MVLVNCGLRVFSVFLGQVTRLSSLSRHWQVRFQHFQFWQLSKIELCVKVNQVGGVVFFQAVGLAFIGSSQHSVHPTGGSLRVFKQFVCLGAGPVKIALSRPAHQPVTQAVRR